MGYNKLPDLPVEISGDANNYLKMAYNIMRYGTFSKVMKVEGKAESLVPTAFREPGYPAFLSLGMLVSPKFRNLTEEEFVTEEGRSKITSYALTFMEMLILLSTSFISMWTVFCVTRKRLPSIIALFGVGLSPVLMESTHWYLTENLAALLLLLASIFLYNAVKHGRTRDYIFLGFLLGILTLTRGIFQFVWLPISVFLLLSNIKTTSMKKTITAIFLFIFVYFAVITPWMTRNYFHFDRFYITERGGCVLMQRSNYNTMTTKEYFAFFLYWTPSKYAKKLCSELFEEDEISRLIGKNPNGFKGSARRLRSDLIEEYGNETEADKVLLYIALGKIASHPFRHLLVSIPIAWRRIFIEQNLYPGMSRFNLAPIMSIVLFFCYFCFIIKSMIRREWDFLALVFPSAYLFGMHVLLTHNNYRYNEPLIPVLWITTILFLTPPISKLATRIRDRFKTPDAKESGN